MTLRPLPGVLLLLWCGVVWVLSDRPDPGEVVTLPFEAPDWALHFVEYLAGGALAGLTTRSDEPRGDALLALGFCALYAVVDEWHQSFVPGRDASGTDVAADLLGASAGIWLATVVGRAWAARGFRSQRAASAADEQ